MPVVILYLPAAHNTHVPDSPVYVEPQLTAATDTSGIHTTHKITHNARKSRMQRRPPAFIYLTGKMGFVLSIFIKSNFRPHQNARLRSSVIKHICCALMHSTLAALVFLLTASTIAAFEHNYTQNNSSVAC
ncbi:hypothetical protein JZU56_02555, partial [bacterium]|nr:hypothetical protein [bacterium]